MYGYEEHLDLTPEEILQKVSQEAIFEWILEEPFAFGKKYKSPFRDHSKGIGTCRFEQRTDGTILFVDFGESFKTHRTCFAMVMDAHNATLSQALKIICSKFNLSTNKYDYEEIKKTHEYVKTDNDSNTIITYDKVAIETRDRRFWNTFIIKPEHLEEDQVFVTNRFYIERPDRPRKTVNVFTQCYAIDFVDAVKLYQPFSRDYKWITNCNEDHIGNFDNLPQSADELVIAKSYKDHRVLRNLELGLNVIWLQNEGMIPSLYILENLLSRFRRITIFFDNDVTGIEAANKLMDILNAIRMASTRMIYLPLKYNAKDPGELVSKEGRADTIRVLKYIGL